MPGTLPRRRWLAGVTAGALLGLARPPAAASQEAVASSADGVWQDAARQREVPWRARWPVGTGPCALVLYSHGLGGSREGGEAWGEAWRAAGLAVLHLQHPGSDAEALRGGLRTLRAAATAEQLVARVHDMRFALDELVRRAAAGEAPWHRVLAQAIGVAGHSFGAHTTQALAGQRYRVPADLSDPRPRAFVALSPSPGSAAALPPHEAFGGIVRPFLAVTGSLDGDPFGSHDTGEQRTLVYRGLPPARRALLWLDGADHMTFAGIAQPRRGARWPRRDRRAEADEVRHHALVARVTTLWWQAHLLIQPEAAAALAAPTGLGPKDRYESG